MTKKEVETRAFNFVMLYEKQQGRNPQDVSMNGCGYDICSNGRRIEVKGVRERWKTYTWQPLYVSEYNALKEFPNEFYLYIVKIDSSEESSDILYIIPGHDLLSTNEFRVVPNNYSITPISQTKLNKYRVLS